MIKVLYIYFFSIDIKKLDRYTLKILFIFIKKWVNRLIYNFLSYYFIRVIKEKF